MQAIIVEDEKHARENLQTLLQEIAPDIEIQAQMDSVRKTVEWLRNNTTDLIFLDIHLADDLSFKIFEEVKVETPIVFTTAYDQYALKAFKVNSIDYLLKPIDKEELENTIDKFKSLTRPANIDFEKLQKALDEKQQPHFQQRFIVQRRDKIMSVKAENVAYFEGEDRYVYLVKNDGTRYIIDYKLSDLEEILDPTSFFRLNRSFIAHFDAIEKIITMSKSRVKIHLQPAAQRDIVVSSANARSFKMWLNQ